jgi:hypothetical protein
MGRKEVQVSLGGNPPAAEARYHLEKSLTVEVGESSRSATVVHAQSATAANVIAQVDLRAVRARIEEWRDSHPGIGDMLEMDDSDAVILRASRIAGEPDSGAHPCGGASVPASLGGGCPAWPGRRLLPRTSYRPFSWMVA